MSRKAGHLKTVLIAAGLISCAAPLSSSALLLGELRLHSYLGQPLRASIPLKAEPDEELDSRCFSLVRPETRGDSASYLTQARLDVVEASGQFQLKIHSLQPVSEPFLRLRVQESCGQGHLSREYTLLIDPVEYTQIRPPAIKKAAPAEPRVSNPQNRYVWDVRPGETLRSISASLYPRQSGRQRSLLRAIRNANPELHDTPADQPLPEGGAIHVPELRRIAPGTSAAETRPPSRPRRAAKKPVAERIEQAKPPLPVIQEGGFHLKLSTSDLDLSLVGKMTEAQRQQLREKQLLLDADDQVANALSMKNRIMQLEEQIDSMQKALEETNRRLSLSENLASPPVQKAVLPSPDASASWVNWLDNPSFRGMAGGGLILALLVSGWWRWRRRQAEVQLESELNHEFAESEVPHYEPFVPLRPEPLRESDAKPVVAAQDDDFLSSATSIFDNESESVTFTEAESVLDEADLYLAYGWANRAIELLLGYLEKHPDDVHLWKKLFEIYNAQGMKQEFEQLALRCQSIMDDSGLWVLVQKMGRQLDAENPLYLSSPEEIDAAVRETAAEIPDEQEEVPTLDTPLDFVLDRDQPSEPAGDKEAKHLELDPLFPDLSENTRPLPGNGEGDKSPG